MSGGDLLWIFTFLILPTTLLVSCVWLYILLRKGVLLPPARQVLLEADEDERVDDEIALESRTSAAAAPAIAMHVAHDSDEDTIANDIDRSVVTQETVEFQTLTASLPDDAASTPDSEDVSVAAHQPTVSDDGTEAIPVQHEHAATDASEDAGAAVEPLAEIAPGADSPVVNDSEATDIEPAPVSTGNGVKVDNATARDLPADDLELKTQSQSIADFDDEIFAPLDVVVDAPAQTVQPAAPSEVEPEQVATQDDVADSGSALDQFDITDEHPIVEVAPAAMYANGVTDREHSAAASATASDRNSVAQPHSNPRSVPSGRRRHIRRPEAGG